MTVTFYKLHHNDDKTKECYVGSTTDWTNRKSVHKRRCNIPEQRLYDSKVYTYIRANGGFDQWTFEILEQHDDMTGDAHKMREYALMNEHGATLNINKPASILRAGDMKEYQHH